jgi:hypothetical protein
MLGDRLRGFTAEELSVVKGSADFYGMNNTEFVPCAFSTDAENDPTRRSDVSTRRWR